MAITDTTWHRYVLWHLAPEYLRCGWMPCPTLSGTHHECFSVHMMWLCDCEPVVPEVDGK